ncbi:hypothetical protein [Fangia hongkongensis]|uniref:hypothetical protein n=1 Tax=Fangia hongkongensis TaxID=270495 RepID=UPI000366F79A|nr:hypothetical protein [Fangia hongkongensis]MBK2124693.1 hypothetical protein [Fangia hongkongensis]
MIRCNINDWPVVRMHFHSYPSYEEVINWLSDCDRILKEKREFVLISTFDEHYQFEHRARKKQAIWFKSVKNELSKWCLGMFRVTQDPVIIKKINAPAMSKGMPFQCIVVEDVKKAELQAHELLTKCNLPSPWDKKLSETHE